MKKLLLSLGTIAAIAAPIGAVIACAPETDVLTDSEIATKIKEVRGESIDKVNKEIEGLTNDQKTDISGKLRNATSIKELRDIMKNLPKTEENKDKEKSPASASEMQAAFEGIKNVDKGLLENSKLLDTDKATYLKKIDGAKDLAALEIIMNELAPKIQAANK